MGFVVEVKTSLGPAQYHHAVAVVSLVEAIRGERNDRPL